MVHALGAARAGSTPQYIEVGPDDRGTRRVEVGLHVQAVDEATLRKTVVMLNNYRRLGEGRHEFAGAAKDAPGEANE